MKKHQVDTFLLWFKKTMVGKFSFSVLSLDFPNSLPIFHRGGVGVDEV